MIIYIAGKITGDPYYRHKFARAYKAALDAGHTPQVSTFLPDDYPYEDCMRMCFDIIDHCDALVVLDDWRDSPGAQREVEYARSKGLPVFPAGWLYREGETR